MYDASGLDSLLLSVFFFFKQNTASELRISDWSSDVCSSDLGTARRACARLSAGLRARGHGAGLLLRHPTSPTGRRFPGPDASQCCVTAVVSNYRCGAAPDLASRRMTHHRTGFPFHPVSGATGTDGHNISWTDGLSTQNIVEFPQHRGRAPCRSEEHTSELQSLMRNTVSRLLLEKKNTKQIN